MAKKIENPNIFHFMNDPSVFGGSEFYKDIIRKNNYIGKYNRFISTHSTIPFTVYREYKANGEMNLVIFHFQVESEKNPDILYDVIFKFTTNDATIKGESNVLNYKVQFFSNSPGFLFQFAFVYNHYSILIPELAGKIGDTALNNPPSQSNPHRAIGYDYTIFYCLRFLYLNQFYLSKKEIMRKGKPINQFVPEDVPSANDVLERRSPQELISFKKLKRSFLGVTEKPKEIVRSIGSSLGLIKAKKASGPKSATKASGTRSARGPRKAK